MVFAKAPIPGEVKTRLLPLLDAEAVSALYGQLILHCLNTTVEAEVGPVALWCTPSIEHPFFIRCSERFQIKLHQQTGGDMGRRMAYAFHETLKKADSALLMGTDCPSLTCADLKEAKRVLQQGVHAVISPTEDGGYALLGLRQYEPQLFEGVSWGTESVLEETRERLRRLGWHWHELPERWDVDRPEDVKRLISEGYLELKAIRSRLSPNVAFSFQKGERGQ
ncbi:MAG: TIGR04282 family arsenosugar biosynthesis glycosyltransferase [Thermodesulfobacteriota bacterium]|nr:TIGR04282 family arsenosugar biosynthesis glycosyltransferase [Thermodesulfobacteriota bacterium]